MRRMTTLRVTAERAGKGVMVYAQRKNEAVFKDEPDTYEDRDTAGCEDGPFCQTSSVRKGFSYAISLPSKFPQTFEFF